MPASIEIQIKLVVCLEATGAYTRIFVVRHVPLDESRAVEKTGVSPLLALFDASPPSSSSAVGIAESLLIALCCGTSPRRVASVQLAQRYLLFRSALRTYFVEQRCR